MDTDQEIIEGVTLRDGADAYYQDCEDRNLRPRSVQNNKDDIGPFVDRAERMGVTLCSQLNQDHIKANLREYAKTPSPRTGRLPADISVRDKYVAVRTFAKYLYDQGYVRSPRCYSVKLPKADDAVVIIHSDHHLQQLMSIPERYWNPDIHPDVKAFPRTAREKFRLRAEAVLAMAMSSGLRRGEISALLDSEWNRERRVFTVSGHTAKGRKTREVPVSDHLARRLKRYCRVKSKTCPYLIVSQDGEQLSGEAMLRQIQRYVAWGRENGMDLPERFTLHSLRHTAINGMLQINPEHARLMAGHQDISTTQRKYGHTVTADIRKTHDQADVLARISYNVRSKKRGKRTF